MVPACAVTVMMAMPHFKTDFLISAGQFTFISSWNHQECNSGGGVEELCTSCQARIQGLSYEYILRALRPIPRTTINLGVR